MRRLLHILRGHGLTFIALAAAAITYGLTLSVLQQPARAIVAWDAFDLAFLVLSGVMMVSARPIDMPVQASAQEDGEWTIFSIVVLGVTVSFLALLGEFANVKNKDPSTHDLAIGLVVATLVLSWLTMQAVFALRYAHEYYTATVDDKIDKGLDFPGDEQPDYWDFVYFAFVLGMTFQVSDVQITSRKLRRLATAHGMLGFLFNTVVVALSVNLAASLVS